MDWTITKRVDRFEYELVDPNNLNVSRGYLTGVSDCKLTYGYYTDTRLSGTLTATDAGWIENSLVRVHHFVDSEGYHNELCTCFIGEISDGWGHNASTREFTLKSMLWRLQDDALDSNLTLPAGSYSKAALQSVFNMCGATYSIADDVSNYQYSSVVVHEAGESLLSVAFKICDSMGARMEVDGHGVIRVSRYIAPALKVEAGIIGDDMIYGDVVKTDDFYSMPNRAVVVYSDGDNTISGYADLTPVSPMAFGRRGRRVTEVHQESDLNPATSSRAAELAQQYLANNSNVARYQMNTLYVPAEIGDVYNIRFKDTDHKCMLQTRDMTLGTGIVCSDTWRSV